MNAIDADADRVDVVETPPVDPLASVEERQERLADEE